MRKALNENPVVQAALIGILVLGVGLLLVMRMGGSSGAEVEEAPLPAETTAPADPAAATPADPAAPAEQSAAATPPADQAQGGGGDAGSSSALEAGPGLPKELANAYDAGDAVVLLIVNENGIDDRRLEEMVEALRSNPDAAVFVTDVRDVARYSRITEGVDLDRTPALVVIRPESLTDGPMPTAVVSYGFRGGSSVKQALEDALYKGPADLPYYPN